MLGLEGDEFAVCRPWVVKEAALPDVVLLPHARPTGWATPSPPTGGAGASARRGGAQPSPEGWDSEMVAYGSVCDHAGRRYLFYNGNRYGKTGFGVAIAEA